MRRAVPFALLLVSAACAARPPGVPVPAGAVGGPRHATALSARFRATVHGGCSRTTFTGYREGEVRLLLTGAGARLELDALSRVTFTSGGYVGAPRARGAEQRQTVTARWAGSWRRAGAALVVELAPARTRCDDTYRFRCEGAARVTRLECRWAKATVQVGSAARAELLLRCVADAKLPVDLGAEEARPVVWLAPGPGLETHTFEMGLYPVLAGPTLARLPAVVNAAAATPARGARR
jgi:hypothetical protein